MPIGTGDSQLFQDEFHMHANDFLQPPQLPSEGVDDKDTLPNNFAPSLDKQMVIKPHDPTESDANIIDPITKSSDFMTEVSDHSGFNLSNAIEDRRKDSYPFSEQWGPLGQDVKNRLFGTPAVPEAPVSPLSKKLGHEDVKITPAIDPPIQDTIMQELGRAGHQLSSFGSAFNKIVVKGQDPYDTDLTDEEEKAYSSKYSKDDSKDYDMRGFFKANPDADPHTDGTHYPDTYKKPNHPTFSDESQYHNGSQLIGGHWGQTTDGEDTFTPGETNIKTHGLLGLIDYFDKVEPNAHLLIPKK